MKKLMKKICALILMCVVFLSVTNPDIVMAQEDRTVSSEEFIARLTQICDNNGVKLEINSIDNSYIRTESEVEEVLNQLEKDFKNNSYYGEGSAQPSIKRWNYSKTYTISRYIANSTTTGAAILVSCTADIYDGTTTFVRIYNITSRQYGTATGFVSWTQKSSSAQIAGDKKSANVSVTGTLQTQSVLLGVTTTYTYDYTIGMNITPSGPTTN